MSEIVQIFEYLFVIAVSLYVGAYFCRTFNLDWPERGNN